MIANTIINDLKVDISIHDRSSALNQKMPDKDESAMNIELADLLKMSKEEALKKMEERRVIIE